MPGLGSVALRVKAATPTIRRSVRAIRKWTKQPRNTVNRAGKLAAREEAHVRVATKAAGDVAETSGAAAAGVALKKAGQEATNGDKEPPPLPPPPPPKI